MKILIILSMACVYSYAQTKDSAPRNLATVTFANLGTPANGTIVYCSDCIASNPAASGGTGAVARRENGAWNSGGGGGSVTDGVTVTSQGGSSRKATAGSGVTLTDSGAAGNLTFAADTAVMLSQLTAQSGTPWSCISPSGSSGGLFTCTVVPTQASYPVNQFINWIAPSDTDCVASNSININGLGPITLQKVNSSNALVNLTTGDCKANFSYILRAHGNPVDGFETLGLAPGLTGTNCSSSASPAVCAAAPAGSIAIPTGVNPTLVVNTSAVTANSQIFLSSDDSLGTKLGITCNSTLATLVGGMAITARTGGTSFTISYNGTVTTNALCASYLIIN